MFTRVKFMRFILFTCVRHVSFTFYKNFLLKVTNISYKKIQYTMKHLLSKIST